MVRRRHREIGREAADSIQENDDDVRGFSSVPHRVVRRSHRTYPSAFSPRS